jgi:outer membrane protein OmpA-like peptidoglycan-associated protein
MAIKSLVMLSVVRRGFVINAYRFGYTDAKGPSDYNQKLSERRAQAVRDYLVAQHDVAPNRLQTVGYGLNQLADPIKPLDAINRRVQVINIGASP